MRTLGNIEAFFFFFPYNLNPKINFKKQIPYWKLWGYIQLKWRLFIDVKCLQYHEKNVAAFQDKQHDKRSEYSFTFYITEPSKAPGIKNTRIKPK